MAGPWQDMNFALLMAEREQSGRGASPSAAVMGSQGVRTTKAGEPRGFVGGGYASEQVAEATVIVCEIVRTVASY